MKIKSRLTIIAGALLFSAAAQAQTFQHYGPQGQHQGTTYASGYNPAQFGGTSPGEALVRGLESGERSYNNSQRLKMDQERHAADMKRETANHTAIMAQLNQNNANTAAAQQAELEAGAKLLAQLEKQLELQLKLNAANKAAK